MSTYFYDSLPVKSEKELDLEVRKLEKKEADIENRQGQIEAKLENESGKEMGELFLASVEMGMNQASRKDDLKARRDEAAKEAEARREQELEKEADLAREQEADKENEHKAEAA